MIRAWQGRSVQWLISGGYLVILAIGAKAQSAEVWRYVFGLMAALACMAWQAALRRSRLITDTPTSSISAASQGLVELKGRALPLDGRTLGAPLKPTPCLWYRFRIERREGQGWATESSGESTDPFVIDDGTGPCTVEPEGAEVLPMRTTTWRQGDRRYHLSLIVPGESLYVMGAFRTWGGSNFALDAHRDTGELLALWKEDMPALLQRHDRNGDGALDAEEWEQVRHAARQEVGQRHQALRATPEIHYVGRPEDGRLFLISSLPPTTLVRRFRLWAIAHLLVLLAALYALGYGWPR